MKYETPRSCIFDSTHICDDLTCVENYVLSNWGPIDPQNDRGVISTCYTLDTLTINVGQDDHCSSITLNVEQVISLARWMSKFIDDPHVTYYDH